MGKRLLSFIAICMFAVSMAFAQKTVTGTVIDDLGEPVVGASVLVKGTSIGAATDINGKFTVKNVPNSASSITVSYIGMKTKEVAIKNSAMKIALESDAKALSEQVVVAFGTSTKEAFTGSAAVVKAEDIAKHTTSNVANTLVGSVPGLTMRGSSGAPGAGTGSINIRGIASMYSSTDPLIIVDGAPYTASLTNINPDDVESISVLKDASSAALYGARGAAGVILVTTKKGQGKKAQITVDAKWGGTTRSVQEYETITDPGQFMEAYYSQFYNYAYYKQGMSNADANAWVNGRIIKDQNFGLQYNPYTLPEGESLIGLDGKLNPNAKLGYKYNHEGTDYYVLPDDWTKAAYHNGVRQEYNASINGGTTDANYYVSFGYLNEDGIFDNSSYERFTTRFKGEYQATKWLRIGANVGYVHSNTNSNPNLSSTDLGSTNMMYYTSMIAPIYPLYVRTLDANGNPVIKTDEYGHKQYDYGVPASNFPGQGTRLFLATGNPIGANQYNNFNGGYDQVNSIFTADIKFTDWLRFRSVNNINAGFERGSQYQNPFYGPTAGENGRLDKYNTYRLRQNYSQTLTFQKEFAEHNVQVMAGHEWYKNSGSSLEAIANGGFSPDIQEINAFANRYNSWSSSTAYNVEGWFGNALYNYAEKYYASLSYRRDATSRFHKDHRWGNFWSVGAAWIISKENFFNVDFVNMLKLKASIGQQGNDGIGDYNYVERYNLSKGEGTMLPSFSSVANPDITWETTTNMNVGLEFGLFNNRLTGSVEFYNKKAADMLFWLSIPESYGARGYYGNLGDIRNLGVEVVLAGDIIRTKDFTWNVSANLSHNKTKILSLPDTKTATYGGFAESSSNIYNWYEVGKSLYNAMMPEYAGVNEKGEALYWVDEKCLYEKNNDGITNSSRPGHEHSFTTTEWNDATYYEQGSVLPKLTGGFATSINVYGFDISATFDYQIGGKVYDYRYASLMSPVSSSGNGQTYHKDVFKAWTPNSTSSNIPRFQYQDQYATAKSTRFMTNAGYLNFQSVSVGYTVPARLCSALGMSKIRVYCQGENLMYWSARKGLDTRYSFLSNSTNGLNAYSPVRSVMGGIQVSF